MVTQSRPKYFTGPVVGIMLAALTWGLGFGPGFLTLATIGGIGFVFVTPMIQLILNRTNYFRSRTMLATIASLMFIVIAIMAAIVSGNFNYW